MFTILKGEIELKFVFMHSVKAVSSDKTLMTDQKFNIKDLRNPD
jgi:hypothetical protein